MNIVMLSGGSGKRLWPLSNEIRSKQFIKIFRRENGIYESMIQRMYRQLREAFSEADIVVTASRAQIPTLHNQLGENVEICVEPAGKNTFPALALVAAWLKDVRCLKEDEPVLICPVDPYVEEDYYEALRSLWQRANTQEGLFLLGILPTYPSEKYGYILPAKDCEFGPVDAFWEKPSRDLAQQYISRGALWNGGVFACRLGYLLERAHEGFSFADYDDLYAQYTSLNSVSFDYAVVEKEKKLQVLRFKGSWKDMGTWNTLTEAMEESCVGNVTLNDNCRNVHVIYEPRRYFGIR